MKEDCFDSNQKIHDNFLTSFIIVDKTISESKLPLKASNSFWIYLPDGCITFLKLQVKTFFRFNPLLSKHWEPV